MSYAPFTVIRQRLLQKSLRAENGCLEWQAATVGRGYGVIYFQGRNETAHRVSYKMFVGQIPEGMWVLHRCDNPPCIEPSHLFLGTHEDNMKDLAAKDRHSRYESDKTHCPSGHPYSTENTYVYPTNAGITRKCKTCINDAARRRYYEK